MTRRLKISLTLLVAALAITALVVVTAAVAQDADPEMAPAVLDTSPVAGPVGADTTDDTDVGFEAAIYGATDDDVFVEVSNTRAVDRDPTFDDSVPPTAPTVEDTVPPSAPATGLDAPIVDDAPQADLVINASIDARTDDLVLDASIDARDVVTTSPANDAVAVSTLRRTPDGPLIENQVLNASLPIAYTAYDLDTDGTLDIDEFAWAFDDGWFDDWDLDADDAIYTDEFATVAFLQWDLDGNLALDVTEWNALSLQVFGDDEVVGAFADWDLDDDVYVSRDEFTLRLEETGLFSDWDLDRDGLIDRVEFDAAAFGFYDLNDDARVDDDELYLEPWF